MFTWGDAKHPAEIKVYAFDWAQKLSGGDTIATVAASLIAGSNAGLTILDDSQHSGALSYVRVSGGMAGLTAAILGTIITAGGETLSEVGRLTIAADNAPLPDSKDLTTLAAVKAYGGIIGAADDEVLQSLVTAYSAWVQQYINRTILAADYTRTFSGYGGQAQLLPDWPINAVASVTVDGVSIPARTTPSGCGFWFDDEAVILSGYRFGKGRSNITIAYNAGYASVPPELAQAVNEMVHLRYALRDKAGWASKTLAGETVSLDLKDMPNPVRTLLDSYKAVVPV